MPRMTQPVEFSRLMVAKTGPSSSTGGAGALPLAPLPKVPKGQTALPGYATTVKPSNSALRKNDLQLANIDLTASFRTGATTGAILRNLVRASPDMATGVSALLRVGIPEKYKSKAYNADGTFNRDATALAMQILARMDYMPDYTTGFAQVSTIRSLCESLGKELVVEGAAGMELVLDKSRLPSRFQPIPTAAIEFWPDGNEGLAPKQVVAGVRIDLDIPTFIYTSLDQPLMNAYPVSPIESAIQPVLASMTFLNDLRSICARHVYPRYDVSINEDKLRARFAPDILTDSAKLADAMNEVLAQVEEVVNNLGVEDALIHFDFMEVTYIGEGMQQDVPGTFDTVKNILDAKVATGIRALPAILGHGADSQNVASTETMLFMVTANSMIRCKLQEILSKGLTLAVRLFGLDVTVKFEFDDIDLRPAAELEAFKSMRQSRILEQLSFGFITDDEAAIDLTGNLTPDGFTPLSGTMFTVTKPDAGGNPHSGTSTGAGGGAGIQSMKSKQPAAPKKSSKA